MAFQLWYNSETEVLYETRLCLGAMIMYAPFYGVYGGMWINQSNIDNPRNSWAYIGKL
jgi:hypothetical protein